MCCILRLGSEFAAIFVTVCSCHVMYGFQSESTLYSCLNVKELLAQSRHKIWSLSDCSWTRTKNHLVCKRTLKTFGHSTVYELEHTVSRTYGQMHLTDKYSEHSSIIGWVFVYELSGSGFKSTCSHLYLSPLFASPILLCKSPLILPGRHSLSHKKKKADNICISSWKQEVWKFDTLN